MQDNLNPAAPVSSLAVDARSEFIWKCYAHVVGAILAVAAIETYLFQSGVAMAIAGPMLQSPMLVLMAFIALSWGASHLAHRLESTAAQYAAFAAFGPYTGHTVTREGRTCDQCHVNMPDGRNAAIEQTRTAIELMIRLRILKPEGNRYRVKASYENGLLNVNGFPVPIPQL